MLLFAGVPEDTSDTGRKQELGDATKGTRYL